MVVSSIPPRAVRPTELCRGSLGPPSQRGGKSNVVYLPVRPLAATAVVEEPAPASSGPPALRSVELEAVLRDLR